MNTTIKVNRNEKTMRIRVNTNGEPLSVEDRIQLQILEYEATNTAQGIGAGSTVSLRRSAEKE